MEIELITVGKSSIPFVVEGTAEYIKRLKHYITFRITSLPDVKRVSSLTESRQREMEGESILARLQTSDFVALLDERGREFTSVEFSQFIEKRMVAGSRRLVFVVGGPYGFSQQVYDRADTKISLSRMTFNHEMVRLFFVEQVYRAMTILRGEPYHHA